MFPTYINNIFPMKADYVGTFQDDTTEVGRSFLVIYAKLECLYQGSSNAAGLPAPISHAQSYY